MSCDCERVHGAESTDEERFVRLPLLSSMPTLLLEVVLREFMDGETSRLREYE